MKMKNIIAAVMITMLFAFGNCIFAQHEEIPNYVETPDTVSVRDGNWFDTRTWSNGIPNSSSDVIIFHDVIIQSTSAEVEKFPLGNVVYANDMNIEGKLSFATYDELTLHVRTLTVRGTGELNIGTENNPVTGSVEIIFADEEIDTDFDPLQFGHGLLSIQHSSIIIYGKEKTPFLELAQNVSSGSDALELANVPINWQVGDKLWLPDTSGVGEEGFIESEYCLIESINGTTITLQEPLQFSHEGIDDFLPHVANLTRNVVLRSENKDGTRAHVMSHHRVNVDINNAAFVDLGRTTSDQLDSTHLGSHGEILHLGTNQIGRYSYHMHHVYGMEKPNSQYQWQFKGNVIDGGKHWGLTIHDTHYGIAQNNVIIDVDGAGIAFEDASETENVVEGNFIGKINGNSLGEGPFARNASRLPVLVGDGSSENPYRTEGGGGFSGEGIWCRGANNYVRNNVITNAAHSGVSFWSRHLVDVLVPDFQGADPNVNGTNYIRSHQIPLDLSGQLVYGSPHAYFFYGAGQETKDPYIMENSDAWLTTIGVRLIYVGNMHLDGLKIRGTGIINTAGIYANYIGKFYGNNLHITNAWRGVSMTIAGTISNSFFDNLKTDIVVNYSITGLPSGAKQNEDGTWDLVPFIIDNVTFGDSAPTKISFDWEPELKNSYTYPWKTFVYGYNNNPDDNFQVFMDEQRPDYVMEYSGVQPNVVGQKRLNPILGATNQELWDEYRIAPGGEILPVDAVVREGINGYVAPITEDIQAPHIYNLRAVDVTNSSALICWETSEPSTSQVEYYDGRMSDQYYGYLSVLDTELKTEHCVLLTNLDPQTRYNFEAHSHDATGNAGGYAAGGDNWERETLSFETE
jgi:hypothetical protein